MILFLKRNLVDTSKLMKQNKRKRKGNLFVIKWKKRMKVHIHALTLVCLTRMQQKKKHKIKGG